MRNFQNMKKNRDNTGSIFLILEMIIIIILLLLLLFT